MAIPLDSLEEGKEYVFMERNKKLLKLLDTGDGLQAKYEYFDDQHNSCVEICSAKEFADKVLVDYIHDPAFAGIYPFIFMVDTDTPQKLAQILNKEILWKGKKQPLKKAIQKLINDGFIPAFKGKTNGLYHDGHFIPREKIGKVGMQFAEYLSREKGWDGVPSSIPDFILK